jgi:hypothetical protein
MLRNENHRRFAPLMMTRSGSIHQSSTLNFGKCNQIHGHFHKNLVPNFGGNDPSTKIQCEIFVRMPSQSIHYHQNLVLNFDLLISLS